MFKSGERVQIKGSDLRLTVISQSGNMVRVQFGTDTRSYSVRYLESILPVEDSPSECEGDSLAPLSIKTVGADI